MARLEASDTEIQATTVSTVELCLTTTLFIQPSSYYDHILLTQT